MDGDSVAKVVAAIMSYFETLSAVAAKHQGGRGDGSGDQHWMLAFSLVFLIGWPACLSLSICLPDFPVCPISQSARFPSLPGRFADRSTGTDGPSRTFAPPFAPPVALPFALTVAPVGDFCVQNRTTPDKLGGRVDSARAQKNPANLAISQGLFSEVDGARTRNLRRDRPVL
jgi:hypothetical protein